MDPKRVTSILGILLIALLFPAPSWANNSFATLSGNVTDQFGSPIANARVSVSNVFSGQTVETQSDRSGHYSATNLGSGSYEVSASAEGFVSAESRISLAAGTVRTTSFELTGSSEDDAAQSSQTEPTLSGLGFPKSEMRGNAKEQAMLNKRSHMLQIHQKLGMITVAAMIAALVTSSGAKGRHGAPGSPGGRNLHMALGATTAGLYAATAYFALAAPRLPGVKVRGPIRLHKAMAWIHGPGMVMTAILGAMAYSQLSNGERVHGIAKYHSTAALVTAAALGTAVFAVAFKF